MENNFCGLEPLYTHYSKSKIVILPVPYDGTRTWITGEKWKKYNTSKGPAAIITASQNMELYDIETDKEVYREGIDTLPLLEVEGTPEEVNEKVYSAIKKHLEEEKFVVMIGGEHSISAGAVRAFKEKFAEMSVLQLDAHADLREAYTGTRYSHATVMSRIKEMCPITQVGIRSSHEKLNGNCYMVKDMDTDDWMDEVIEKLTEKVYITIDLDVFDPSIMPSVGTPEPGGMRWYETLKLLRKIAEGKKIIGFDVVELAPSTDIYPDFLAAKLIYKLLNYIF